MDSANLADARLSGSHALTLNPHILPTSAPMESLPLSVLDLSPITQGSDAGQSLRNSGELARHVERPGYNRFWMAEHHSMPAIASAATAVALAYIGAQHQQYPHWRRRNYVAQPCAARHRGAIRHARFACSLVGSTWASVALRAPTRLRRHAMRRNLVSDENEFPHDVLELMGYFRGESGRVRAIPARASISPSGFSALACSALNSRRCWGFLTPSPPISRRR